MEWIAGYRNAGPSSASRNQLSGVIPSIHALAMAKPPIVATPSMSPGATPVSPIAATADSATSWFSVRPVLRPTVEYPTPTIATRSSSRWSTRPAPVSVA